MVAWPVYSQEQSQDIEVFLREKTRSGRDELNVSMSEALHIGWSKHIFYWLVEASALCMNIVANKLKTKHLRHLRLQVQESVVSRDRNLTKRRWTKPGNLEPEPEPNDETKNFKQVIDLLSRVLRASSKRLEVKYTVD